MKIKSVDTGPAADLIPNCEGFFISATTHRGEVFLHKRADLTLAQCERLAERVRAVGEIDEDHWYFWRTVYGSEAYEEEVAEVAFILGGGGREDDLSDRLRELA